MIAFVAIYVCVMLIAAAVFHWFVNGKAKNKKNFKDWID
jgi:hypothetical protein